MVVCNVTDPGNYFHLLRRQVKWPFRKPLVVFTPKKLLRHPMAVSSMEIMAKSSFQKVVDDPRHAGADESSQVDTVMLCTGKIYYDILEGMGEEPASNLAFVRLEQLHPLPFKELEGIVQRYGSDANYVWVQEEPQNMGAWSYMLQHFTRVPLSVISRPMSASPASGSSELYKIRQTAILDEVFAHASR